jgi:hypothetical protein
MEIGSGLFLRNHIPFIDELVHDSTLVMDIHVDQNVGHQVPILDDLALLVARIGVGMLKKLTLAFPGIIDTIFVSSNFACLFTMRLIDRRQV